MSTRRYVGLSSIAITNTLGKETTVNQRVLDVEGVKNLIVSIEAMGALPNDRAKLLRERTANFRITPEGKALLDSTLISWERGGRKEVS